MAYEGSYERGWQNATCSCLMVKALRKRCSSHGDSLESSVCLAGLPGSFLSAPLWMLRQQEVPGHVAVVLMADEC